MKIDRHNYEAFLLDLHEGSLSVDEQQQLREFLLMNPDCNAGILEGESCFLEPEKVHFQGSRALKKELPNEKSLLRDHNFDLFSIARMEGDLSHEQEEAHRSLVETDTQKADQWLEWQRVRLIPDAVLMKEKEQLYNRKGSRKKVFWLSAVSAAAAISLIIVLFRMGPVIPPQELGHEVWPEAKEQLSPDTSDKVEQQQQETASLELQPAREVPAPEGQKKRNPLMFSIKKEHELPEELHKTRVPTDDMQARPVKISENKMNTSLLLGETVPDRIEPLDIPPVSIHLRSLTIAQLSQMDLQEIVDEYSEEQNLSLWTIARAGIKGINRITGSDISLLAARDEEGEVSGFQLKSKRFSMTSPLGREK